LIKISCHSRNYGFDTPDNTLWFIKKLGFDFVTLDASTFPPEKIYSDPAQAAKDCRALLERHALAPVEYVLSDLFDGEKTCSATDFNPEKEAEILRYFDLVCAFCAKAGFASVMLVAGDVQKQFSWQENFDKAAALFRKLKSIADQSGVVLNVEPGQRSIINSPDKALALIDAVPGLSYTLDPLQWQVHGYDSAQAMRLLPYSRHMHARQAAAGWNKCPLEFGEIDYDLIIRRMRGARWDGTITMEFWLTDAERFGNMSPVDQTIVLRYQIKQLIRKYWSDTVMPL